MTTKSKGHMTFAVGQIMKYVGSCFTDSILEERTWQIQKDNLNLPVFLLFKSKSPLEMLAHSPGT